MVSTLFPPISEEDSEKDDVLSPELRTNFKQLRSFLTQEEESNKKTKYDGKLSLERRKRKKSEESNDSAIRETKSNRINNSDCILSQRFHLAAQTLITAQNEISLMCKGIVELEELLASNEEAIEQNVNQEKMKPIEDCHHIHTTTAPGGTLVSQDCTVVPQNDKVNQDFHSAVVPENDCDTEQQSLCHINGGL